MLIWETSREDHSKPFLRFEFFCESPPSCFKANNILETPQVLEKNVGTWTLDSGLSICCRKGTSKCYENTFRNRMIVWNTDTLMLGKY